MYNSKYAGIEDARIIPEVRFDKGKTPADVLNKLRAMKHNNFAGELISENKRTTNGAIAGLVGGLLIAFINKKNKMLFSFVGMLAGASVGYTINVYENYKKNLLATQTKTTKTQ